MASDVFSVVAQLVLHQIGTEPYGLVADLANHRVRGHRRVSCLSSRICTSRNHGRGGRCRTGGLGQNLRIGSCGNSHLSSIRGVRRRLIIRVFRRRLCRWHRQENLALKEKRAVRGPTGTPSLTGAVRSKGPSHKNVATATSPGDACVLIPQAVEMRFPQWTCATVAAAPDAPQACRNPADPRPHRHPSASRARDGSEPAPTRYGRRRRGGH